MNNEDPIPITNEEETINIYVNDPKEPNYNSGEGRRLRHVQAFGHPFRPTNVRNNLYYELDNPARQGGKRNKRKSRRHEKRKQGRRYKSRKN